MALVKRVRPRFGDVIEIETPKGFAYVQYTHNHQDPPVFGKLVRVLPGFYEKRPNEFSDIVQQKERFWQFIPISHYINKGLMKIVANEEIPDHAKPFPVFREGLEMPGNIYSPDHWSLWSGKGRTYLKKLLPEHFHLSILSICDNEFLVERISSDYKPEDEVELN